jgi:hypothetical protein
MTSITPLEILREATLRRIKLLPRGDRLAVTYPGPVPQDFEDKLIDHKVALIKLLNAKRHLARQVLSGEFFGLNDRDFGLISSALVMQQHDPICALAAEHLREQFLRENPDRK